jgi:hypothetical protein
LVDAGQNNEEKMEARLKYAPCTLEEKQTIIPKMQDLVRLSKQAMSQGILSLEKGLASYPDSFMRVLFGMLVDAIDLESIESYGRIRIATSGFTGGELIEAMAVLEAVLSIGRNESQAILCARLSALLGVGDAGLRCDLEKEPSAKENALSAEQGDGLEHEEAVTSLKEATVLGVKIQYHAHIRLVDAQIAYLAEALAQEESAMQSMDPEFLAIGLLYMPESARTSRIASISPQTAAVILSAMCDLEALRPNKIATPAWNKHNATDDPVPAGGVQSASMILKSLDLATVSSILGMIIEKDAGIGELVARDLLSFDDLALFDAPLVRDILSSVPPSTCIQAINGTGSQMWEAIQPCLPVPSSRALDYFRQNLTVSKEAAANAQADILQAMRRTSVTSLVMGKYDTLARKEPNDAQP